MPLHAKGESRRVAHPHRLDRTIGGPAFRYQGIGNTRHTLTMQRVYLNRPCAQQIFEGAAFFQRHVMGRAVLDVERIVLVLAVVEARREAGLRRHFVDMLMKGTAEGDVQFLKAAADGKERHAPFNTVPDERQRQRVALTVEQHALARRRAAVILGMDV